MAEALDKPDLSPPELLRLTGHPLRWRLLTELGRSDRLVGELTSLVGQPQNLVSYHLGKLRVAQLVSVRRSSADQRDAYYSVDLVRCAAVFSAVGAALHPGLAMRPPPPGPIAAHLRVLFLCTGNSARSQMAQALLKQLSADRVKAYSAGSHPKALHPNAVRVIRAYGIDIAGARTKHLNSFAGQHFDYVITLCDRVREVCPEYPEPSQFVHWSLADPAAEGDTDQDSYVAFERAAVELRTRIRFLLHRLQQLPPTKEES